MKNDVFAALSQKSEKRSETSVRGLTEMFGLSGDIKVTTLSISSLKEKANHPFKVLTDDKLNALAESIKANGLMEPIIVRTLGEGTYEILAGHRRTRATQLNGESEIKAIVIKADDELANRIMISTNFQQRDSYLPSEIARSYLIRYTDLKNRKKVKDENSNGWNSEDKIDRIMEKEWRAQMKKKNEIIVNAFYVHDEVIEEPSCVEESFYEVDEDEDLDAFLRFLMKNRKLVKPFIHKKREKKEVLVFKAENLSAVIPHIKSEKVLQRCKDIMAGKARRCDKCGTIILDKYFCTYRDLHGMVGLSYECCACRGVSDRSINRVFESYLKRGTKKTQIQLLKKGRI